MPLDFIVTTTVEKSLNALLQQSPEHKTQLLKLQGKVLRVSFREINKALIFQFDQKISVVAQYQGDIDCELGLAFSALPKLKDKAQFTQLIRDGQLHLDGDLDVAQHFTQLLMALNPDPAEWLSRYTGDIFAHTAVKTAKRGVAKVQSIGARQQRYAAEVLIEEWRLAPGALEIAHFADSVDDLNSQTEQLAVRLQAIERRLTAPAPKSTRTARKRTQG